MSRTSHTKAHALALEAGFHHIWAYIGNSLLELLLRAVCLMPLIYLGVKGSFFGVAPRHATGVALLCCLPLWLVLVLPMRYRLGGAVTEMQGQQGPDTALSHYPRWLWQLMIRLLKALPFLLPLAAWLAAYYYYAKVVDFPQFFLMVRSTGGLLGGTYATGMALLLLLFALCLAVAIIGWRRLMVFFYLPLASTRQDGARLKQLDKRSLRRISLMNLLILLPPLALLLAGSLLQGLKGELERDAVNILTRLTEFDLATLNLRQTGPWLLLLYLPFALWRKMALAQGIHGEGSQD